MQALTTESAEALATDLKDLTSILELLASSNSISPSASAAFELCANAAANFLEEYHKVF